MSLEDEDWEEMCRVLLSQLFDSGTPSSGVIDAHVIDGLMDNI
jgi:hypothetical protein